MLPDFNKIKYRVSRSNHKVERLLTGVKAVDSVFGGLPIGITVFVGEGGSGKSLLAKSIAHFMAESKKTVLYAISESYKDDPGDPVVLLDYMKYKPMWTKVLAELEVFMDHYKPSLLVLDSSTRLFSGTRKAVEEADLSPAMWQLSELAQKKKVAIIAISEVRGYGSKMYPAGGMSIHHVADMYVEFERIPVTNRWISEAYNEELGNIVHVLSVTKDKEGMAETGSIYNVQYGNGLPIFFSIRKEA